MTFEFLLNLKPSEAIMQNVWGRGEGEIQELNKLFERKERTRKERKEISLW